MTAIKVKLLADNLVKVHAGETVALSVTAIKVKLLADNLVKVRAGERVALSVTAIKMKVLADKFYQVACWLNWRARNINCPDGCWRNACLLVEVEVR